MTHAISPQGSGAFPNGGQRQIEPSLSAKMTYVGRGTPQSELETVLWDFA